jgi:ABC-2 type transport system ATP-binding protein
MRTRLELASVSKAFGTHQVLTEAWLHVRAGETVGLLGANGAGKTTLMRIAAGLVRADGGSVRWPPARPLAPPRISYFGGEMTLPPAVSARRWAALFGVTAAERRPIGRLSRGSRQSLGLRVVLSGAPADLLLLDEPWEGLDPSGAAWLTDTLRRWARAGCATLVSSHRLYDLDSVCTRFVMLENGRCAPLVEREEEPRLEQIERAFMRGVRR